MLEYDTAIDELFNVINVANNAGSTAIIGAVPKLYWAGVVEPDAPDTSKFWGRVSQQTVLDRQQTFSTNERAPGKKLYEVSGLLFVQCFCPQSVIDSMAKGRVWAKLLKNTLRGAKTPGGIWFRNVRIQELPPENMQYRLNVVAEYQHGEIS